MRLAYHNEKGIRVFVELTDEPIVIGRSQEADVILKDDRVSLLHCGIRFDEGHFVVKDLGSRNGTFVNARRIDSPTPLEIGDNLRVGATVISIEEKLAKGTSTILHEIEKEMDDGKGYNTLLREIVEPADEKEE